MEKRLKWFKLKNQIPTPPKIPNFLAEVDLPQADDSANVLREKAAAVMEAFANMESNYSIQRDHDTWLDVAQKLAQGMSPGERVTREDLHMLVDQLKNPGSELFLKALELLMKRTWCYKWLASVLKRIPQDGTFDQLAPLVRLKGQKKTFCYDLSAATDRWPLLLLFEVFQVLFDRSFASSVVNSALATNVFKIPFVHQSLICLHSAWSPSQGYWKKSWSETSLKGKPEKKISSRVLCWHIHSFSLLWLQVDVFFSTRASAPKKDVYSGHSVVGATRKNFYSTPRLIDLHFIM